jgi:energy-coupling factor transporter transmembrane protein EcfT
MGGAVKNKCIIKADKKYRKNLFNVYLIGISIVIAFWHWGIPVINNFIQELPIKKEVETLEILAHVLLLLFFAPAVYLIYIGRKIRKHSLLPYPGMRVIRDTHVLKGKKAVVRGNILIILGITMICTAILSMTTTHVILVEFKTHPLIRPIFYGVQRKNVDR